MQIKWKQNKSGHETPTQMRATPKRFIDNVLLPLARKISPAIRVGGLDAPYLFSPLITASQVGAPARLPGGRGRACPRRSQTAAGLAQPRCEPLASPAPAPLTCPARRRTRGSRASPPREEHATPTTCAQSADTRRRPLVFLLNRGPVPQSLTCSSTPDLPKPLTCSLTKTIPAKR